PVLVERRPTVGAVLLEGEREVDAVLEISREDREGAQAEAAECVVEVRRAHAELTTTTAAPRLLPDSRDTSRRCAHSCPAARNGWRRRNADSAGRPGGRRAGRVAPRRPTPASARARRRARPATRCRPLPEGAATARHAPPREPRPSRCSRFRRPAPGREW